MAAVLSVNWNTPVNLSPLQLFLGGGGLLIPTLSQSEPHRCLFVSRTSGWISVRSRGAPQQKSLSAGRPVAAVGEVEVPPPPSSQFAIDADCGRAGCCATLHRRPIDLCLDPRLRSTRIQLVKTPRRRSARFRHSLGKIYVFFIFYVIFFLLFFHQTNKCFKAAAPLRGHSWSAHVCFSPSWALNSCTSAAAGGANTAVFALIANI